MSQPVQVLPQQNSTLQQPYEPPPRSCWAGFIDRFLDAFDWMYINVFKPMTVFVGICMRIIGPCFVVGFYYLMGYHTWIFLTVISPVLRKRLGICFGMTWTIIGVIITYNVVWNHMLAMCLKPGSPKDLIRIEKMREQQKQRKNLKQLDSNESGYSSQAQGLKTGRLDGISKQMKCVLKYRHKTVDDLRQFWTRHCKRCEEVKPARTHHCMMCDRCVYAMDHHCPWVNNCLGAENYRYFLLYLVYLTLGSIWYVLTIVSIWDHYVYRERRKDLSYLLILNSSLILVLIAFNAWNWYLAMSGTTTIEFWKWYGSFGAIPFDFSFDRIRDNLFLIFGTQNVIRMFSPSLRPSLLSGLEWSFVLKERGIPEDGDVYEVDQQIELQEFNTEPEQQVLVASEAEEATINVNDENQV